MQLSVIIVSYNVKYFLEQCLCSVQKAVRLLDAEIIVVDNSSADGSIEFLQPLFPQVKFIANRINAGFGKANNQALLQAKGNYILFLNPDTIVPEDCFTKCISFFENNSDCGALGIRMIDGSGRFLPESKRSFPLPFTSFFKLTGLSSLFPQSRIFNRYALGHLDEKKTHIVDVLAGAFMMARKEVLDMIGGFDEIFFMYGEDVDLSYRIQKTGYKNYYFSGSCIIHFKGESTKRGSMNYVKMFYSAMSIFVNKHYGKTIAKIFSFLIHLAIWLRAFASLISRIFNKVLVPLIDACLIFFSFTLVEKYWVSHFREGMEFNNRFALYAAPLFTFVFLLTAILSGIYDNLYKSSKAILASVTAVIVMLAVYSLFPESLRFSRGVILIGGTTSAIVITFSKWLLLKLNLIEENEAEKKLRQTIIVGSKKEYDKVMQLLQDAALQERVLGRINVNGDDTTAIGDLSQLSSVLKTTPVSEVVICEGYLSFETIISIVQSLRHNIKYRFHSAGSHSIVGSDSKATTGETLSAEGLYKISQPYQKRMKRIVDIMVSIFLIITFPFHLILMKKGFVALYNALLVLVGYKTWVGYTINQKKLPHLAKNILTSDGYPIHHKHPLNEEGLKKLDVLYAREYDWLQDLRLIFANYKRLGG